MIPIDWQSMLVPQQSVVELVIRGTAIYFGLFIVLRILVRRHVGAMSLQDLLVIVLIADAAQNAMASEYRSLPEGFILCATIIGWSFLFDWCAYRFAWMRPIFEPSPLLVVRDGVLQRQNMKRELMTVDELMSHLRVQGVNNVQDVKTAYIEPDGQISVNKVHANQSESTGPEQKKAAGI